METLEASQQVGSRRRRTAAAAASLGGLALLAFVYGGVIVKPRPSRVVDEADPHEPPCNDLWCRKHHHMKACIHSASLAWPWDSYPAIEFVGMRRTQSCWYGDPDFDGPEELLLRCTGPVVFDSDHPRYKQELLGPAGEDDRGFCCTHRATANVVVTDVRLQLHDYGFLVSDLPLGGCHITREQLRSFAHRNLTEIGSKYSCQLSGAFEANERSLIFSMDESEMLSSPIHVHPAVTCPQRILHAMVHFVAGAGVVLLCICLILARSSPIG